MEKEIFTYFKTALDIHLFKSFSMFPHHKIYLKCRICYDAAIQDKVFGKWTDPYSPPILYSYQKRVVFPYIFKKDISHFCSK